MRRHVVITGTGRAGTTFLVELLTHIGLDTGFTVGNIPVFKNIYCNAGLENNLRGEDPPYIVKDPAFCDYCDQILENKDIFVERVYIPVRDLTGAAESRRCVSKNGHVAGGLWGTNNMEPGAQELVLAKKQQNLLLSLAKTEIPIVFIHYPMMLQDAKYLYFKLLDLLWGRDTWHIVKTEFIKLHGKLVQNAG
jgi:hypothetical protein